MATPEAFVEASDATGRVASAIDRVGLLGVRAAGPPAGRTRLAAVRQATPAACACWSAWYEDRTNAPTAA